MYKIIKEINLPRQKTDSVMNILLQEILKEELPEEWEAYHFDSFTARDKQGTMQYRFQGIFTLGPVIMHAPLSVLKAAKRYQIQEHTDYFVYTIWLETPSSLDC